MRNAHQFEICRHLKHFEYTNCIRNATPTQIWTRFSNGQLSLAAQRSAVHNQRLSHQLSRLLSGEKLADWVPRFADLSELSPCFNTLTATVKSLRSTQLIEECQRSI